MLALPALSIVVAGALPVDQTPPPHELRGAVEFEQPPIWKNPIVIGAVLLLVVVAAMAAFMLRRRARRGSAAGASDAPIESADREARRRLAELAAQRLPEQGLFHPFTVEVSSILRRYIERRFGVVATKRSTEEFLRELLRLPGGPLVQARSRLESFLTAADLVKFARHQPGPAQCSDLLAEVDRFVTETAPTEVAP